MPSPLIIPGVQVTALFEPEPVLPGAIGILGVVGITDRGPAAPTAIGNMSEFTALFGPASRFTMPEVRTALTNGVAQVVVARVMSKAEKALLILKDSDNESVVVLEARAEGTWANKLKARVTEVKTPLGTAVKYVNIDLLLNGEVVESFKGLVMDEESPNYLFDRINQESRLVVAYDHTFLEALPKTISATQFSTGSATAASVVLDSGSAPALTVTAKTPGRSGNKIAIIVRDDDDDPAKLAIEVRKEGEDPIVHPGLAAPADIKALNNSLVSFTFVETDPTKQKMPDKTAGKWLTGGRDADDPALLLLGDAATPQVELLPASEAVNDAEIIVDRNGNNSAVAITVRLDGQELESFGGLVMDPDDPRYLVDVLRQSKTLRARDLAPRSLANTLPRQLAIDTFHDGTEPLVDEYMTALDNLELAEEVDLVIASTAGQLREGPALQVQQAVVAHCTRMADKARTRIGLGSIFDSENDKIGEILGHADDVRSDHFILTAPARTEAALAGLLGRLDYFRSPTFKTIASIDAPLVPYTDSELSKLIIGNVAVITKRTGMGTVTVKGLLTSSRQINVQRTANVAVRRVKAIADRFIGLLNDDGTRNALRQQVIAMFLQMEKDGAIVPSVDGVRPAFSVAVYSSPNDAATGIVRIDVAMLPVHAIDYIYATLLVQN